MRRMRTPRTHLDLRLAESYVPAALVWGKGLFYTTLCVLAQCSLRWIPRWSFVVHTWPILTLYYDHLLLTTENTFIDSSSVCVDLVMGHVLMQVGQMDWQCLQPWCWAVPVVWSVFGACHVHWGDALMPRWCAHAIVAFVFSTLLCSFAQTHALLWTPLSLSQNHTTVSQATVSGNAPILPFYLRALSYLLLFIVDAYMLRSPLQKEEDRISFLRYGSLLFATSAPLAFCTLLLALAQGSKLYHTHNQTDASPSSPILPHSSSSSVLLPIIVNKPPQQQPEPLWVDSLDVQEAFRLAKLQYMNGKAAV